MLVPVAACSEAAHCNVSRALRRHRRYLHNLLVDSLSFRNVSRCSVLQLSAPSRCLFLNTFTRSLTTSPPSLQVEELMRAKPVGRSAPIAATGLGLLDRFGDKMESLADSVERQVSGRGWGPAVCVLGCGLLVP